MSKSQRQLAMLGVLLAVLAVTLYLRMPGPGAAAPQAQARVAEAGVPAQPLPVSGLHLELLAARSQELPEVTRNPFRFQARPAPAARVVSRPPAPLVIEPQAPVGPPPPPPIPLKFIGVLDAPARVGRLAILSDSRGGVFYGKEGDTIEGRYRVLKISTESAELAYMDGRGRQTIRLTGQ